MLCKLHSVYNTLHTLCDITQKVSNHYTVEGQFFAFNLEKNYTGQKIFTQTPSVASVTNMRYALQDKDKYIFMNLTSKQHPHFILRAIYLINPQSLTSLSQVQRLQPFHQLLAFKQTDATHLSGLL